MNNSRLNFHPRRLGRRVWISTIRDDEERGLPRSSKNNLTPMSHTHELRVHRRTHQLKQAELAHLIGVSPAMVVRMEQGAPAQLADVQAMLGLELVFGKPPSEIFAALFATVEEAVLRRAAELEAVWRGLDDAKSKAKLSFLGHMTQGRTADHNAV